MCGVAMDVPLAVVYALSLLLEHERVPVPGAVISGLIRPLPSLVTGPRLLKPAMVSVPVIKAPAVYDAAYNDGGSNTVEQPGPELPAATTIWIPAAAWASTAACNVSGEQPSEGGQIQELLVISGALVGSP